MSLQLTFAGTTMFRLWAERAAGLFSACELFSVNLPALSWQLREGWVRLSYAHAAWCVAFCACALSVKGSATAAEAEHPRQQRTREAPQGGEAAREPAPALGVPQNRWAPAQCSLCGEFTG